MENERQKAIDAGNILIAQFLGYKYYGHPNEMPGWKKHEGKMIQKLMTYGEIGVRPYLVRLTKELAFHKNWDWLMPAVDKIDSLGYRFEICNNQARIYDKELDGMIRKRLFPTVGKNNKEATYLCVTQFINWYNENKPEEI